MINQSRDLDERNISDVIGYYSDLGTNAWLVMIEKGNETHGMVDIISGSVTLCSHWQ